MARIKTKTHEVTILFCGNCGVILPKQTELFDKCRKCKEVIEP